MGETFDETLVLLRAIKTLRNRELTTDQLDRYNNLIDCLLHELFRQYGTRGGDGDGGNM